MSQLLKLAQALGLASLVASAAHNPAEYFIPPLGPRFMGHFYDRTPDSCYPSGDAVHVVYIAAGEAAQSRLLQFTAQIADMSKKGYFNDQIYLHFVVDKDNQAVIKEWRSNFENLDGHRPRHVVSSDPPISASVDGMSLEVRPSICGVFHHFEHMCSHARLSTRLPLSEDEPNTPGEMAFREQRCRHSYRNIMQYFQTVGADLLDPPRFIVLVNGWHSLLLDTAMLKAAASMLTGEQPVGLHTQARSGASLSEALACGHIVDDCLCMSPAAVNTSFICDPLDDFMLLSFENATALIALEALVRDQPLEIDFMNLLWRRAGNKYYTILPSHLRHRVQPLMHYRHGTVSQSVGLDGEFNYRYQSPGSNSAFVLEDRGFSSEPSSDASIWCPDLNPEATHPHQSVGRQWVGGDNGRFCLVVTPIEKLSKGRVEESNKESVEESSEGADVDGGQIAANPFIAILDNGILGACASTRLSELNYMNWLLLTSYEACDEISACETVGLQWQGSTADREVDNSSIMQWMVYSSVLEESILPVAPDTGTTDGTRNGAKNYFSLLLDRLLPSSMWRFDKYSESFWSSSPVNNLTMERYLMKRRATLTAEPISINLSRRARLRRPLANITASVGAMDTGIWDVLYTSLNKDRIVGMDNRPLPVSRAIKQEKVLILGEDQAYSLKYDKLISGIPRLHLDNLFTETVAMPDKLNFRDNSSQSVIMVRVSILEMLLCGEVYSRFHRLPKGDVVSALRFDGSDVIFNKVTIDRKPFIDKYFVAASQKCPQNELYKLSAEVSSSDTTLIPREDLALVQAIDSSLTLVGLLIPTGGSHQVVHRYKLRHFEIPVAQPLSSISEQSSERIVAPLSSSVLHSGLNGGIDVGCGPDPRCGQAEAACLAGVRLAEEALVGDRAQITRVEALSTRDRDLVLRELLKQMPHALQPDPSGPTIITVSAPVIELATYTHSKTEDDFFDKATSAEQAKRKSILRIKEKQRRFIPDRRLAVAVSAMSLRVFGWGLFQVNSLVVHSGWATDSPPEADESIEDGDYHIVRPNLWSGLQLGALASAIHPSALALLAHLTYIVDRYADLPDIVIFSEPSLPTDLWLLRDEEIDTQEILNLPLRDNMKLSPHIGIYADIFDTENIQIAGIIEAAISFSFSMEDNWIDSWRLFCNLHQSSTAMLCRPNNPYLFYASRALIQASNRSFYLKLLNDLKEASSRDIAYGALTFGADAGYLLALLLAGTARACQIQPGQNPDLLAPTILWPTLNQSYFYLSPSLCAESPFHTDVSSFIVKVFPLILQSGRDKISEVIFDSIFDKHMAATARPRLRADDMQALKNKALTVYVYDLPPRFHRHWLDMGTTILCWQDHPWDRSPCEFLKGPHRSMWPRQTVVCSDGDPTKQSLNGTSVRSCIVQDLPESSHEMFSRSYHLSPYRTIDPAGEILMLMRLLLSLRFVTVTEHADRADLFIMPYLASSASFFSRNVKATPPLSDGPFPLDILLENFVHLNKATQRKHLLLSTSECIGCIDAAPDCTCCDKRYQEIQEFSWDWQVCGPHVLEELFPEMIRLTLGPRQHGNRQHIIVPSLILDADHQPGAYPGGGSDYVVALEETSDFVGAISANRDIYFKSWSNVTSAINKSETEQRPILLAVFTTFHPNLNQIFSTAMNTRERLVISILSFLRRQGHIVNTTNLVSYAHLFERDVGKSKIPVCSDKNYNDLQCSRHKAVNILVHVGDLAAKVVFPTRRTMTHVYRRSVFCPIPPGDVPHGSRFFHAALSGCIPVVLTFEASIKGQISWHMDKGAPFTDCYPFSDRIDYTKIVIEIPGHRIDEITEILQDVPYEVILEKQKNLQLIRNFFIHDYSGVHSDTYSYLLAQILANL